MVSMFIRSAVLLANPEPDQLAATIELIGPERIGNALFPAMRCVVLGQLKESEMRKQLLQTAMNFAHMHNSPD